MFVKIIPKSQRAKNRIKEHGEIMLLIENGQRTGAILVQSLNETFVTSSGNEGWMGWFDKSEADYIEVASDG